MDSIRACEAEFADLSARVAAIASTNFGSGNQNRALSPGSPNRAISKRLHGVSMKIDALQRRLNSIGSSNRSAFLRSTETYDEIQAFLGLPSLEVQLREIESTTSVEVNERTANGGDSTCIPSPAHLDPTLSKLICKYGARSPKLGTNTDEKPSASFVRDADELLSKYSSKAGRRGNPVTSTAGSEVASVPEMAIEPLQPAEETTMELRSQLIFSALNRNPGQGSSRPVLIRSEPIKELADLPTYPSPQRERKIENARLGDAIDAALAKSCDARKKIVTNETATAATTAATTATAATTTTPAGGIPSGSIQSASIRQPSRVATQSSLSLTPKVPTTLPSWQSVEEEAYGTLPSFVRNQIELDELNTTSKAVHGTIARRVEQGDASVVFTAADVEEYTDKAKAFVNALVKLNMIKLKAYGQEIVYYFCDIR